MEQTKRISPLKSIRKYCLMCSNGSPTEVRLCPSVDCDLYIYRLGRNPYLKGKGGNPEGLRRYREKMNKSSVSQANSD